MINVLIILDVQNCYIDAPFSENYGKCIDQIKNIEKLIEKNDFVVLTRNYYSRGSHGILPRGIKPINTSDRGKKNQKNCFNREHSVIQSSYDDYNISYGPLTWGTINDAISYIKEKDIPNYDEYIETINTLIKDEQIIPAESSRGHELSFLYLLTDYPFIYRLNSFKNYGTSTYTYNYKDKDTDKEKVFCKLDKNTSCIGVSHSAFNYHLKVVKYEHNTKDGFNLYNTNNHINKYMYYKEEPYDIERSSTELNNLHEYDQIY